MSDIHGYLPSSIEPVDTLVIAGDITPCDAWHHGRYASGLINQERWIRHTFMPWLERLPAKHKVMIWGNHDFVGETNRIGSKEWPTGCYMLTNEAVTLDGITFYGVPQTPRFLDWAFNEDDTVDELGERWVAVPDGVGVLVSHGPPRGTVDWLINRKGERAGSITQMNWLTSLARNLPRVVFCGHLHAAGGAVGKCGDTDVYNVALVDDGYRPVREPLYINLDKL